MIEENKINDEGSYTLDDRFDRGDHPEYYDSLVCVRSPYTGVLDPPRISECSYPDRAFESIPFERDLDDEEAARESRFNLRAFLGRISSSWNRFRFAMASFSSSNELTTK